MNTLDCLVGKTITQVRLSQDQTYILFETSDGMFAFYTEAACCSESWINHISGLEALIGQKVTKVEEMENKTLVSGDTGFSGRQCEDEVYSFKIFTCNGVCELEMRNASNGYYGGRLEPIDPSTTFAPVIAEDF